MEKNPFLDQSEAYLYNRGEFYHSYLKLGAHPVEHRGIRGTHFAVWVPDVFSVSVVGSFNQWRAENYAMTEIESSGLWTLFVPRELRGALYKYEIHTRDGQILLKSDPFAFFTELRPNTASIVYALEGFPWEDQAWIRQRQGGRAQERPLLIYEVHAGSWRRHQDGSYLNWRELAEELPQYVRILGYTHIELLPIMEHPFDGSWGYQVTGYYSVTARYGTPHDFMYFINRCHLLGIGIILDWVPGHFCKDAHGLGRLNGSAVYEDSENDAWGTYNFNFAKTEVWSFLIANAIFWFDRFHVDGLRVDGVSSMLYLDYGKNGRPWKGNRAGGNENLEAVAFMRRLNEVVFQAYPGALMIAEESSAWPLVTYPPDVQGLGYNFKWNMGWMNDTLRYLSLDFTRRQDHHHLLTFSLTYAFSENYILPLSHDEVVHGKKSLVNRMPGDYRQKFAGLRCLYGYLIGHPGKKMLFMGGELAQFVEWREHAQLDWFLLNYELHQKLQNFVRDLNRLYRRERALWENEQDWSGFAWIDADNARQSILIFCRKAKNPHDFLIFLINFHTHSYENFRLGVPRPGSYREILNSDQADYGGEDRLNPSLLRAEAVPWHQQSYSIVIRVAPLAAVILKPT